MNMPAINRLIAAALIAAPAVAQAQLLSLKSADSLPPRHILSASLVAARPLGEFADQVGKGFGADGSYTFMFDRQRIFGIRVAGTYLNYGSETFRVPLSSTIGGRILVDVNTTNNIAAFSVGPYLQLPRGPVRPYVAGGVGFGYFFTESSVRGGAHD